MDCDIPGEALEDILVEQFKVGVYPGDADEEGLARRLEDE